MGLVNKSYSRFAFGRKKNDATIQDQHAELLRGIYVISSCRCLWISLNISITFFLRGDLHVPFVILAIVLEIIEEKLKDDILEK